VYLTAMPAPLPHVRLSRDGVPEALSLLNAVLYACAKSADPTAALALYHDCRERHPGLPDAVSVNSVLAACAQSSEPRALRAGFDALRDAHAHGAADARGVDTLLKAASILSERGAAARLLSEVSSSTPTHAPMVPLPPPPHPHPTHRTSPPCPHRHPSPCAGERVGRHCRLAPGPAPACRPCLRRVDHCVGGGAHACRCGQPRHRHGAGVATPTCACCRRCCLGAQRWRGSQGAEAISPCRCERS
jgi:hypothetical protein